MAKTVRIIPRLDIKGPNLVKGIHLEGLRVMGKPEQFARYYYETGADELLYMDVVASLYNRNSLHDIIMRTAREIFIPLTVGGGLRTIDDICEVLRAGADKVVLNTAAINNPQIVKEASREFGSSTIVIAIEAIRQPDGRYLAYTDNGRQHTGVDVFEWAKKVAELGAGEIIITSVDHEGTGKGYDHHLTGTVAASVPIPVIAHGGAGNKQHVKEVITEAGADAVSVASLFHYDFIAGHRHQLELNAEGEGNIEFLKSKRGYSKIEPIGLKEMKLYLHSCGVDCRQELSEIQ